MDYKEFFTSDNKSGWKTREDRLKTNFPEVYNELISFINSNSVLENYSFKEKIWFLINNIKERPKCEECTNDLKFGKSILEGFPKYCSINCTNKNEKHISKSKNSKLEKYGNYNNHEQYKKTCLKKHGVENIFEKVDYIKEKFINKYGVEKPLQVKEIKEKWEKTNIKNYGVKNNFLNGKIKELGFIKKKEEFLKNNSNIKIINVDYDNITINCEKCKSDYIINRSVLWHRQNYKVECCVFCNPIESGDSYGEKEIYKFVKDELQIKNVIENDRTILKGKELDILLSDYNLAIEFDGLYWHSDIKVDKDYHLNKTLVCKENNIQLLHVFQDEWFFKKEIVKSIIKNKLNISNRIIYGRKCKIKEIKDNEIVNKFLDSNHIQGQTKSLIKIGLYYENELISIMTFGKQRIALGGVNNDENSYEMIRFCNKLGYNVIGGASKLFKWFIKNHNPSTIISFADRRYFDGGLYSKLGFDFINETKPNYWYIKKDKRVHRFNYRKDILVSEGFDSNKTEFEIMAERGIHKIYDCGNFKFIWSR